MGKPQDMVQRRTLARIDDIRRRTRVKAAQQSIYEKNNVINSRAVEDLMQEESLVPTSVSSFICFAGLYAYYSLC